MISINNIFIKYGDRVLLNKINLTIGDNDKLGLVGRNGSGKSTILKIIAGDLTPDEGQVVIPGGKTIGYLHQDMNLPKGKTVLEEALTAFDEVKELEKKITHYNHEIATRTDYESDSYSKLIMDLSDASERFHVMGGESMEADAEKVLKGLGFKSSDMNRLTDEFSGGWKMRIELTKMLLQHPDYLLLDEPTNHLDIESIIWLENFLKNYTGAVITISHDKQFLDNVTQRTVELEWSKLFDYKVSYSKFVNLRVERRAVQAAAFKNQQKVIAEKERTISRFMAKATKTKMAQSMQKQLDKIERIEIDSADTKAMVLNFPPAPRSGAVAVETHSLCKNYGSLEILQDINLKLDRGDRVAFVGQNGQGKTTLARMLINDLPATSGEIKLGHNIQIGYYAQDQTSVLDSKVTLLETMEHAAPPEMRTRIRSILGAFMFSGEDVDKKVMVLSGGEKARLALACLLLRPFNLLVLDEPTNHLDILSKDILKKALSEYDGTMIIVSHDRDFLEGLTTKTIEFRDKKLHTYLGDVNFFLKKRAMDNMREVEMRTQKAAANKSSDANAPLDYETKKRLLRAVQNAERKIEKLETKIAEWDVKMADPSFYQQPNSAAEI
ncbi:MAG TPA: ABC transporter ATP-binding protein, partial [Phaeodactylibacter sp.]|nr:ABC transporter ATP-binding protein [Phaeodactylibacter sp.]